MAGESPDRSERERSSGETTEDSGSVPAARRQDPRETFAAGTASADASAAGTASADTPGTDSRQVSGAEAEGEAGDARLRAAVAAWVSTTEAEADAAADEAESGSPASDGSGEVTRSGGSGDSDRTGASGASGGPGAGAGSVSSGAGGDLPVRPRGGSTAEPPTTDGPTTDAPATDTSTTMFGVRPDLDEPTDKESAAARAERMTAAFFGARKGASGGEDEPSPPEADGEPDAHGDADGDEAAPDSSASVSAGSGEAAAGEGAATETADAEADGGADADAADAADAAEEATGSEAAPEQADGASAGSDGSAAGGGDAPAAGSPGDEDGAPAGEAEAASGEGGVEEAAAPASGAGDGVVDQPTAVFRAVAPEAVASDAESTAAQAQAEAAALRKDGGATDQPTTAIRLSKTLGEAREKTPERAPGRTPEKGATAPRAPREARDGEGRDASGSRFVPLQDADAPRTTATADTDTDAASAFAAAGVGGELERTKQQPVPDPPPLELLAQLTNKPAPPETPLRTLVRRVKIWTPLVVLLAIVFAIVQAVRPLPEPALVLTADATHTFDGGRPSLPWPTEGQAHVEVSGLGVLGSYGEQKPVPIGSVAKTMTAYLVLQKFPLKEGEDGPMITVDEKAEKGGNRGAGNGNESVLPSVEAGDRISERDALSALMIPSANNIARLLARWHSGSEAAFVEKMNEAAEELGMANTTYTDPSGLKESTVSTAEDQVKLGKKVMEFPALVEITKMPYWVDPFSGDRMRNYNTLVPFNGAVGIKTGTTTAAGGNLLFAGYKEVGGTRQLIVGAVLGQHKPPIIDTVNAVSRRLLIAAGETLTSETIVRKGDVVGFVDDGLGGRTPVVATEDVQAVGWGGLEVELALEAAEDMPHAAPAGEKAGVLTVGGGPGQVEVPVALQQDLTEPGFGDKLTRIL